MKIAIATLLLSTVSLGKNVLPTYPADQIRPTGWKSIEQPIAVTKKTLTATPLIKKFPNARIVVTANQAYVVGDRDLWIVAKGKKAAVKLSSQLKLPPGFDYYMGAAADGDRLVVSVANYPETQIKAENATEAGQFRAGPAAVGLLVIDPGKKQAKLIKEMTFANPPDGEPAIPTVTAPPIPELHVLTATEQGMLGTGSEIAAKIDLKKNLFTVMPASRFVSSGLAILERPPYTWVSWASQEGGGDFLERSKGRGESEEFNLGIGESIAIWDMLLHQNDFLVGASVGLTKVDETSKTYTHYVTTTNPKTLGVTVLRVWNKRLFGLRDDGFLEYNLAQGTALHYQIAKTNNVLRDLALFDGRWIVSNEKEVVVIDGL